jgi:hypothetical protein
MRDKEKKKILFIYFLFLLEGGVMLAQGYPQAAHRLMALLSVKKAFTFSLHFLIKDKEMEGLRFPFP